MRKFNYLECQNKARAINKVFDNRTRFANFAEEFDVVYLGSKGNAIDVSEICKCEFKGNCIDIMPYVLMTIEYTARCIQESYNNNGMQEEFRLHITGDRKTNPESECYIANIASNLINKNSTLINKYHILETIVSEVGISSDKNAMFSEVVLYSVAEYPKRAITLLLNYLYLGARMKSKKNKELLNEVMVDINMIEKYNKSAKSVRFDHTIPIVKLLIDVWFKGIIEKYGSTEDKIMMRRIDKEYDLKYVETVIFKNRSIYKKYLEGKATVDDVIQDRKRKFKTRLTDYEYDILSVNFELTRIRSMCGDSRIIIDKEIELRKTSNEKALRILHSNIKYLDNLYIKINKLENKCSESVEERKRYREISKQLDSKSKTIIRQSKNIEELNKRLSQINETMKESVPNSKIIAEQKKNGILTNQVRELTDICNRLNCELADKTKRLSELRKENKRVYTIREVEEREKPVCEVKVSYEQKLDAIRHLNILLCGISTSGCEILKSEGLNIDQMQSENDTKVNKRFDVLIILTSICPHTVVYRAKKRASAINAKVLHLANNNKEMIVDLLYKKVMCGTLRKN